jgi:hypothetical protein
MSFTKNRSLPIVNESTMNSFRNLLFAGSIFLSSAALPSTINTDWGSITTGPIDGEYTANVTTLPEGKSLSLPSSIGHVTHAYTRIEGIRSSLEIEIDAQSNQVSLVPPTHPRPISELEIHLETGEQTTQFANGRILFSSKDAIVGGNSAKLESNEGNHRIGFWTNAKDSVSWAYKASRPGMYQAELTYSKASGSGTTIRLNAAKSQAKATLPSTGSWYRYRTVLLGKVYIPQSGNTSIKVTCEKMDGGAVMNLKSITLTPTGEGNPVVQGVDGMITLHASDATIQGVKVQYESLPHKNTVGYWVNESDWAYWDFTINRPGAFAVEILQGCGKGHGGSEVLLQVGTEELRFHVEETGHFQNFVPRYVGQMKLGRPDQFRLAVKPIKKAAGAVMDLRRIRLIPVLK